MYYMQVNKDRILYYVIKDYSRLFTSRQIGYPIAKINFQRCNRKNKYSLKLFYGRTNCLYIYFNFRKSIKNNRYIV